MRAVARGMVEKSLPLCPERCGGQGIDPDDVSEEVRRHRARFGCDAPIPDGERSHYAIRCPACDGRAAAGVTCERCADSEAPGFLPMRRCPASCLTPDISQACEALRWAREGSLPENGSVGDQAASWVGFRALFEREVEEAREDQKND